MSLSTLARIVLARTGFGAALGRVPLVESAYAHHAAARRDTAALHWGIFETYDEAAGAIPSNRVGGWDNPAAATIWTDAIAPVRLSSYPVFFWLRHLLQNGSRLTDLGGSIGLTFYGYRQYAELPNEVQWSVVEVPHIAAEGRRIALREGVDMLDFETELTAVAACDVLLAAGVLQYMPTSVPGLLESMPMHPRYILLNKLPFTRKDDFWTLQNFGPAISPYHVFNEQRFLGYFTRYGYTAIDRWDVTDMSCDIPFHPDRTVAAFTGLCLSRAD